MDLVERFAEALPFPIDGFQRRSAESLAAGRGVLVCAPTGAGKTVVGEFGVWLAVQRGGKAFYTTPIKALSNQKFGDFVARYGSERVGLLTGDNSINGEAPVVVMTTEVLRNMLYERSPTLEGLGVVVMDEVHYLRDQYRGATWEEVLIHLPERVQVVALSATVSNADEFGAWLRTVRGDTDVVIERTRPVPIEHRYLVGTSLMPMFTPEGKPDPALMRARELRGVGGRPQGRRPRDRERAAREARRVKRLERAEVVERLREERMVPAIAFIFSRAGCDAAVAECVRAGIWLTTPQERERIREYVELRTNVLPADDLAVLGYEQWRDGLERGLAAHHAGLIPLFKETVEELFERALVKVVFATETLALGINMPAKTVVLERLVKFTGERHEMLTPADYTQLTGRAGRRGMDPVGYGVTLLQRDISFEQIAALAVATSFPLVSSFRPAYNMAVNLLRTHTREQAEHLLNLSFAQFLADRGVVKQEQQITRNEEFLAGYRDRARCDRGDVEEWWRIAVTARAAEREEVERERRERGARIRRGFEALRPGSVVMIPRGGKRGLAVVVRVARGKGAEVQPTVVTRDRRVARLSARDFREPPAVIAHVALPDGDPRAQRFRHDVAQRLDALGLDGAPPASPAADRRAPAPAVAAMEAHPVWSCPDRAEHERWMVRIDEIARQTETLRRRVRRRTETLARMFDRVLDVLIATGYVVEDRLTPRGEMLARVYTESDLLVADALAEGVLDGLDAPSVAAVVSSVLYDSRVGVSPAGMPTEPTRRAFARLVRIYRRLAVLESDHGLELVREPDPGFGARIHAWASGESLDEVLGDGEMSPGDFVRSTKQVWDLLRQLADVAEGDVAHRCEESARAIYRGVVAYSGAL